MTDSQQPRLDEHDTLPPDIDPAVGDETVEPPTKLGGILKRIGPGLIIAGSIVGSGELIATTKTGAQAGILLLWLIIIGCLIKVFVQIELGRYTIGHGETTLAALDQVPGPRYRVGWIVWFWLLMMLLGIGQLGGIVGGVGQAAALAMPVTGDYADATRYPSSAEIQSYLKWDAAILSEFDLAIAANAFGSLKASGETDAANEERFKALAAKEPDREVAATVWRLEAGKRTLADLQMLAKFDAALANSLVDSGQLLRDDTKGAIRDRFGEERTAEMHERLKENLRRANALLLEKVSAGELKNTIAKKLTELSDVQRERVVRGHSILAGRLREMDRIRDGRIVRAIVSIEELKKREQRLSDLQDNDGARELEVSIAQVRVDEQKSVISAILDPPTWDDKIWAAFVAVLTAALLYRGRYGMIQNVSTVLVVAFTFITIGNVIALQTTDAWHISMSQFLSGLSFQLPEATDGVTPLATALATFGIIGVGASELIAYPYWCLEKGYAKYTGKRSEDENWARRARGWMKVMHYDAFASMIVYTVATIAFFLMGVAVLYNEGRDPDGMRMVSTLATAYVPVFGEYSRWLFLGGAVAVLYSTFLVATAGNARMYTDAVKIYGFMDHNNQKAHDKALSFFSVLLPFLCLAVFCSGVNPVRAILLSGAMQALLLPMIGVGALYFRYTRADERIAPGRVWDVLLILSFLGLLVAGTYGAYKQIVKFF